MDSTIEISNLNFPAEIEHLKEFVELTDEDGILRVFSYKHCNNTSENDVKKCRGLVFKGEQRLFRSLGYTPEYTENDKEFLSSTVDMNEITFFKSEEGTLIRLFYVQENDKWYVSTHRKLDAFKSRWGGSSDTFGDIFVTSLKHIFGQDYELSQLFSRMNKNNVYLFLIRNTQQNRIVSHAPEIPMVYHVGTLVDGKDYDTTLDLGVRRPDPLVFANTEDLFTYVNGVDPFQSQGVIGFYRDGSQFKVLNSQYQLFSHVRGNESSVMFRYLQVRGNPTYVKLMYELYPEKMIQFTNYENAIFQIAKNIHFAYMERFINKKHVVVSKEEYKIVSECHGWHISDRANNKVTLNVVLSTLSQPRFVSLLNFLVKNHINSSLKKVEN